MKPFAHIVCILGCASLVLALPAAAPQAQATATGDVLTKIRGNLRAGHHSEALSEANRLLESTRNISNAERVELLQLLAAAYYPATPGSQHADSAQFPLAALIRSVPDITIARELSWSGLDALTERVRAETFAVVTRPDSAYTLSAIALGHITAVASRPTRFVLSSVDALGHRVIHDSSAFVRVAALQLRTHDAGAPIFSEGTHALHVWAYDSLSGDSLHLTHRVVATRRDVPAPRAPWRAAVVVTPHPARLSASRLRRSAMLVGGVVLAAGTVVIAQVARPHDSLHAAFGADPRAYVVAAAMVGAAVANFFIRPAMPARAPQATAIAPAPVSEPLPAMRYQVHLQIDPAER